MAGGWAGGPESTQAAAQFVLDSAAAWDLGQFSVVGSYVRFEERERVRLAEFRQRVEATFLGKSTEPRNFLLWGAPGSGKSYLVQQIASSLEGGVRFAELNLGELDEEGFRERLDSLLTASGPAFCF